MLYRSNKRINNLKSLLDKMKSSKLISDNTAHILEELFSDAISQLLKRMSKNRNEAMKTTAALRTFALTLNFLSSKAYNYVRSTFYYALPHPTTLGKWYSHINGEPGINAEGIRALVCRANEQNDVFVSLTFDEMSVRKHIDFDGEKNRGYIDFGTGVDTESLPVAGQVLVYTAVAVNANWKVHIAYFFISALTGPEKVNITKLVVEKVSATVVRIISVTCDGPSTNFSMAQHFGLNLTTADINTKLNINNEEIYFLLGNCHMLIRIRNTFFQQQILYDCDRNEINVHFIKQLQLLQESGGLHLANKLTPTKIDWRKQLMKVKLATQTLSASVADAIDFFSDFLKLPQFQSSKPASKYIGIFDRKTFQGSCENEQRVCAKTTTRFGVPTSSGRHAHTR